MFEFRINVAMDEQHDGCARHVFTTEWMDRADFDRAAEHVTDTMLVQHGYRITLSKRSKSV
ncbi:hypothetical protein [Burkholderia ambifaria]|uniref:hypothetical protein n=1 Tax=Burkholderia ambifaria TaxID=152480 RepID=UPI001BA3B79A|nr:hypothetical protein [Burkholderia ambifaria]MBR8256670.1 hypothetical protein [Burkholderia ambifaria]